MLPVIVVVVVFAYVLPKIADYGKVWGLVQSLSWPQTALLIGAALLNLVTFAPPWMAALPGLSFTRSGSSHAALAFCRCATGVPQKAQT